MRLDSGRRSPRGKYCRSIRTTSMPRGASAGFRPPGFLRSARLPPTSSGRWFPVCHTTRVGFRRITSASIARGGAVDSFTADSAIDHPDLGAQPARQLPLQHRRIGGLFAACAHARGARRAQCDDHQGPPGRGPPRRSPARVNRPIPTWTERGIGGLRSSAAGGACRIETRQQNDQDEMRTSAARGVKQPLLDRPSRRPWLVRAGCASCGCVPESWRATAES